MPAARVCSVPGCPTLTRGGRCTTHQREAERARGTAAQRGYGATHRSRFRAGVLARDALCVLCATAPATVADHYPLSRRELVARGLDADDPRHGRGLCASCHGSATAEHQPGGWHSA